jgi:hypothetical protein
MRRLALVLVLFGLLAFPAWAVAPNPNGGPGSLSIRNGRADVILQVRGAVIGRLGKGTLTLTDDDPYDEQVPTVHGQIKRRPKLLNDATTLYRGRKIRFRVESGTYRVHLQGTGIFLSAVGRGWVVLDGDDAYRKTGIYSLNGDPFQPIPYERTDRLKLLEPQGSVPEFRP